LLSSSIEPKRNSIELINRPNPASIFRKSCKPPILENEFDQRGNRSRSVDSGSSKSYQMDLIKEKKKSKFLNQQKKKEGESDEKLSNDEKNSEIEEIPSITSENEEKNKENLENIEEKPVEKIRVNKKIMIEVEDEEEEVKNEENFQDDVKDLGTQ